MLRISGTVNESTVDGPGFRYVIFTQGCPHHCKGCHNPQTWNFDGGILVDINVLLDEIKRNKLLSGVTFSGGEPFMQPKELTNIAKEVHKMGLNVISFTGFVYEDLLKMDEDILELLRNIDILIDGPFIEELHNLKLYFRGSSNQRFIDVKKSLEQGKTIEIEL